MGAPVPVALGVALCQARGGAAGDAPPGLARAGVETPPSPVEVGPSSSLREPASRPFCLVGPGGGMVLRVLSCRRNPPPVSSSSLREPASRPFWLVDPGRGMVLRLLSRHRNPPPMVPPVSSRGISSELSLSRGHPGWGA